ncbi:glutamate synthase, partial [bacterium]
MGPDEFTLQEPAASGDVASAPAAAGSGDALDGYLEQWARDKDGFETRYARVVNLARTGASSSSPMRTQRKFPDWEQVLFRGAQLDPMPLNGDVAVSSRTVIGPHSAHPLELALPFYVS